jgi:hypothetical protein
MLTAATGPQQGDIAPQGDIATTHRRPTGLDCTPSLPYEQVTNRTFSNYTASHSQNGQALTLMLSYIYSYWLAKLCNNIRAFMA